ncbi:hypothetical protein PN499_07750 [Kamptonema animale CS-326]|nr:hypothetical protein [Kamptonema animale]MDB9511073.1 hypothetical protein [Kamptonema animale CS-326]
MTELRYVGNDRITLWVSRVHFFTLTKESDAKIDKVISPILPP